jgi:hypothetical protein
MDKNIQMLNRTKSMTIPNTEEEDNREFFLPFALKNNWVSSSKEGFCGAHRNLFTLSSKTFVYPPL